MTSVDEHGWVVGAVAPLPPERAYSVLVPEPSSVIDAVRWVAQAARFFAASLAVEPAKRYPAGGWPRVDRATVRVGPLAGPPGGGVPRGVVALCTLPLSDAPLVRARAAQGVAAMGGAGFDVLLARATRLWQLDAAPLEGEPGAALLVAALLASLALGPVLAPDGAVLGVKSCRDRLAALGSGRGAAGRR
ncbi:MAG: hypothetical protein IT373_19165 [Polyangiaceae bacterium]|nr:hypothetical protein [Polyangiaceae bacterium]